MRVSFSALIANCKIKVNEFQTYVERSLPIDICAVDIDFLVREECNGVMDVAVGDAVEHNFIAHLFDFAYHFN